MNNTMSGIAKLGLVLLLAICVWMPQTAMAVANIAAGGAVNSNGKFLIYVSKKGQWQQAGILSYDKSFREARINLKPFLLVSSGKHQAADKKQLIKIKLIQQGGGAAHIDSVFLGGVSPKKIKGIKNNLILKKLAKTDYDVIDAFHKTLIMSFPAKGKNKMLRLIARVENPSITKIPFQFPLDNLYKDMNVNSSFYTYQFNHPIHSGTEKRSIEKGAAFFKEWSLTGTGHPSGFTYGWIAHDKNNLYVTIDFTPDDTMDGGKDYAKVYIKAASGLKEFKVSVPETRWGMPDFTYTDKVKYQHKLYKFRIPFKDAGINNGDDTKGILLAFAAYGTAAPPTITTQAVTSIGRTTATGHGTITAISFPITAHGIVWKTSINPNPAVDPSTDSGAFATLGSFTGLMTGLTPNTLYHVRAYAIDTFSGTTFGPEVTFTTDTAAIGPTGNINTSNKYAWSETSGWQSYRPQDGGVTVNATFLSGFVWAENIGYIKLGNSSGGPYTNLSSTNWGVNRDVNGNLSGYAWSENAGWINFNSTHSQVSISTTDGSFSGFAWGENVGWIHFINAAPAYNVVTTFIPNSAPTASSVAIAGTAQSGNTLTGSYTYADANGDLEGTSTFRWLRGGTAIAGATATTYTLLAADIGTTITFEVTPVAWSGTSPGTAVVSAGTLVTAQPPPPPPAASGADLSIHKLASVNPVAGGGLLVYTLNIENRGPLTAKGVVVNDSLPKGLNFILAAPSQGTCTGTVNILCHLGTMANGATATVLLVVAPQSTPATLINFASVSSATPDPKSNNNRSGVISNVIPGAPSAASLTLNAAAFRTSDSLTLAAAVNPGSLAIAADVYFGIQLPDGTMFFKQPDGSYSTAITPMLSNAPLGSVAGNLFNYIFIGSEPAGTYEWFLIAFSPGTADIIGQISTAPFTFTP